ncbi:MAG TPA: RNA-binding cell elongation regulator Jag/EloR [Thermomicrobiales bacterium]|nr:RNA-binding cell elongation regulator Jag/EloR [Thermomicrobiales bacterium]
MDRMRSVEIQARSAEEAIRLALEQLGCTREQVEVQILAETEDDIYGEGEVLVRVAMRGATTQPRGDRSQPRGQAPQGGGQQVRGGGRGQRTLTDARPRDSRGPRPWQGGGQRRPGHGSISGVPSRPQPVRERQPSQASDEKTQAVEALAKEVVRELLHHMDIHADVMAVDNPSAMPLSHDDPLTVFVDIMGRDLALLIGRRGENLSQMQYMVNLLANKRSDEWIRVILDVEGYRSQREESLIGLAERVARQVARNRRPISLEPMPPNERRIVHMTLKEMSDVRTESSGEGEMRRVTIFPQ